MFLNCGTVICRTLFFFSLFNCALILFKLVGLLVDYVCVGFYFSGVGFVFVLWVFLFFVFVF